MSDAGERGETRSSGGQVGWTLAFIDRDAEGAAAGGEPADNVTVYPRNAWLSGKHASVTAFHGCFVSCTLCPQT
jgi:hypothetical protein